MTTLRNRLLGLTASLLLLTGFMGTRLPAQTTQPAPADGQRIVTIAAAADLKCACADLAAAFAKDHPVIKLQITYGSSGNFYTQLTQQAPFDLFLSADIDYPNKLSAQGLAIKESEFVYAQGRLVLWVPAASKLDLEKAGLEVLKDPAILKIAIANPRHAPYGRAAEAALKKLDVYDDIKDKLVLGDNIAQTAQFVESGAVDIGLIALSLAVAPAMKDKGRYKLVPPDCYPKLEQAGIILNWAQDKPATQALAAFLKSAPGQEILKRYGFTLPQSEPRP